MKLVTKIGLSIVAISVFFFIGCNSSNTGVAEPTISEESLGLRKVDLYSEDAAKPDGTQYCKKPAGASETFERAFQDAPPMIPHDVEDMLPITVASNACTGCHAPEIAPTMGALPYPKSHMTDFRPKHKFDGKKFKKSIDNMKNETSIKDMSTLANARYNCSQCHAPQSETEAPANTFKAEFTSKDGAKKSSWNGSKLTEGLDTLMD